MTDPFPEALAAQVDPAARVNRAHRIKRIARRIKALHDEAADLRMCELKGMLLTAWAESKRKEPKP